MVPRWLWGAGSVLTLFLVYLFVWTSRTDPKTTARLHALEVETVGMKADGLHFRRDNEALRSELTALKHRMEAISAAVEGRNGTAFAGLPVVPAGPVFDCKTLMEYVWHADKVSIAAPSLHPALARGHLCCSWCCPAWPPPQSVFHEGVAVHEQYLQCMIDKFNANPTSPDQLWVRWIAVRRGALTWLAGWLYRQSGQHHELIRVCGCCMTGRERLGQPGVC
jgi:hypothetical protein